jgi:hypothetical protein
MIKAFKTNKTKVIKMDTYKYDLRKYFGDVLASGNYLFVNAVDCVFRIPSKQVIQMMIDYPITDDCTGYNIVAQYDIPNIDNKDYKKQNALHAKYGIQMIHDSDNGIIDVDQIDSHDNIHDMSMDVFDTKVFTSNDLMCNKCDKANNTQSAVPSICIGDYDTGLAVCGCGMVFVYDCCTYDSHNTPQKGLKHIGKLSNLIASI